MTINEKFGIIISVSSIIGSFVLAVRWLVKHYFNEMKSELRSNGGKSLKDQVSRLEERVNEADYMRRGMNEKLDKMYVLLIDHMADLNNKTRSKRKTDI
jgi:hypothetical protein